MASSYDVLQISGIDQTDGELYFFLDNGDGTYSLIGETAPSPVTSIGSFGVQGGTFVFTTVLPDGPNYEFDPLDTGGGHDAGDITIVNSSGSTSNYSGIF